VSAARRGQHEARRLAREAALQILYQWELGGAPLDRTIEVFWEVRDDEVPDRDAEPADRAFAERLARGTVEALADLDPTIEAATEHWRLSRLAVIDRLILRLATWELRQEPETPAAVVINEALELARRFSTEDAVRFINGVLDHVAKRIHGSKPEERSNPRGKHEAHEGHEDHEANS
jgi:transcription antitermination protein NusB